MAGPSSPPPYYWRTISLDLASGTAKRSSRSRLRHRYDQHLLLDDYISIRLCDHT